MQTSDAVRKLISTSPGLATLPTAYTRLSSALVDPAATADKLSSVIRTDPALTARVLKVANSAALGHTRNIETIAQAVVVVGNTRLRHIALASSVFGIFRGIPPELLDVASFWKHSMAVGLAAEGIGRRLCCEGTEGLFISGLLHDIGLLVSCMRMPGPMSEVLAAVRERRGDLHVAERERFGFDHGQVGAALLVAWNLGSHAIVAASHHEPDAASGLAVDVVHLADVVASELRMGSAGEGRPHLLDEGSWARLGLRPRELDNVILWLERQIEELSSLYGA